MPRKQRNHRATSQFAETWGISAHDLALVENTSTDAIHMRVMKWGTPFQRRSKITHWEKKYGLTQGQIALELDIHPLTVVKREQVYGTPYCDDQLSGVGGWNKGARTYGYKWWEDSRFQRVCKPTMFTLEDALARLKALKR